MEKQSTLNKSFLTFLKIYLNGMRVFISIRRVFKFRNGCGRVLYRQRKTQAVVEDAATEPNIHSLRITPAFVGHAAPGIQNDSEAINLQRARHSVCCGIQDAAHFQL